MSAAADDRESRAADLVAEYLDNLPEWTSDEYEAEARRLARKAELDEPINRAPSSIAAGAIYAAGLLVNEKRTQAEVADACDVTKVTIRNTYTEIVDADGYTVEPTRERDSEPDAESERARRRARWTRHIGSAVPLVAAFAIAFGVASQVYPAAKGTFLSESMPGFWEIAPAAMMFTAVVIPTMAVTRSGVAPRRFGGERP